MKQIVDTVESKRITAALRELRRQEREARAQARELAEQPIPDRYAVRFAERLRQRVERAVTADQHATALTDLNVVLADMRHHVTGVFQGEADVYTNGTRFGTSRQVEPHNGHKRITRPAPYSYEAFFPISAAK